MIEYLYCIYTFAFSINFISSVYYTSTARYRVSVLWKECILEIISRVFPFYQCDMLFIQISAQGRWDMTQPTHSL